MSSGFVWNYGPEEPFVKAPTAGAAERSWRNWMRGWTAVSKPAKLCSRDVREAQRVWEKKLD